MTVLVIGAVNADLIIHTPRIALPGETVIGNGSATGPGGKGGNQAAAVARLGGSCSLVARIGADASPLDGLDGVDLSRVGVSAEPTGLAVVMLDPSGENAITVVPGANATLSPADIGPLASGRPTDRGVVLASLEVPLAVIVEAGRRAGEAGWMFVLNPAPARPLPAELLRHVDVLVPNQHELAALGDPDELLAAGVGAVVVTLGAGGCRVHRPGDVQDFPAYRVEAVDTTGAGDAFCGALAWALDEGRGLDDAVRLACAAGALATRAVGARAALPTAAEITALWSTKPT
jgi:ribokinase